MPVHQTILAFFFLAFISCTSGQSSSNTTTNHISAEELKQEIDNGTPMTIIDIRTPGEINATGKIPGSITIDFYDKQFDAKIVALPKDKPIYIYCASGGRSSKSLKSFKKAGFTEFYSIDGGMNAWINLKYPKE